MSLQFFLAFPDFNIRSTPLLILVLQGLVLIALLFSRFVRLKRRSDLFLGLILLVMCYEQICYTVGFMGWYHEYRNTKINYWLIPMGLALAPLIYFYVRSVTTSNFKFKKRDWLHFVPAFSVILYRVFIYSFDAMQQGFGEVQNGQLKQSIDEPVFQPLIMFAEFAVMLLYLAFTFQLFYNYRKKIVRFFSNTYKYELNWILTFLVIFALLFVYRSLQDVIGALITELHYTQRWWLNLLIAIAVLYVGVKGYFTNTHQLENLSFNPDTVPEPPEESSEENQASKEEVRVLLEIMNTKKPYLNPELNLKDLAGITAMNRAQLSHVINSGLKKNFNDFVNEYRIEAVKEKLSAGEHRQLSLLGIAFECGFNSKATFNRVFKKLTNSSPSEYLKTI